MGCCCARNNDYVCVNFPLNELYNGIAFIDQRNESFELLFIPTSNSNDAKKFVPSEFFPEIQWK